MTSSPHLLRLTLVFLIAACSAAPSATLADADGTKPAAPAKSSSTKSAPSGSDARIESKSAAPAKSVRNASSAAAAEPATGTKTTAAKSGTGAAPATGTRSAKSPATAATVSSAKAGARSAAARDKAALAKQQPSTPPDPSEHAATALAVDPPAPEPPAPLPASPPTAAASSGGGTVRVPSTDHVRVDVPPGLQAWLDADDRMRPWLSKAISAVDACYSEVRSGDPGAAGTIVFSVTMHRTARPSADVQSVPGPLRSMVICATRRLLGVKMPLFTGTEGERYSVQAHFQP